MIFEAMQVERRAILTNNARHFVPIARRAMEGRVAHHGLILTSDRALPHTRHNLGAYIELLDELMSANPDEDALLNQIRWLRKPT